jgi:hypothetical protein
MSPWTICSGKRRLRPSHSTSRAGRPFGNGQRRATHPPSALVPDVLLSLDVEVPGDTAKEHRSYFLWGGKAPGPSWKSSQHGGGEKTDKCTNMPKLASSTMQFTILQAAARALRVFAVLRDKSYVPCSAVAASAGAGPDAGGSLRTGYRLAALVRSQGRVIPTGAEAEHQRPKRKANGETERLRAEQPAAQLRRARRVITVSTEPRSRGLGDQPRVT